jgi:hypothetical protein
VSDGFESVAVNIVSAGGGAVHVALDKTEGARTICKEVGVVKLLSYIHASEIGTIDGGRRGA